jgi:Na+/H+ antiporter NhaD/arsenite permease-like protein
MESLGSLQVSMLVIFICGYVLIALEHVVRINKAAIALTTGVFCWTFLFIIANGHNAAEFRHLAEFIGEDAQILLFLLGALTIVEIIQLHNGFRMITDLIKVRSKRKFMWIVGLVAFFLSGVIDNLTTTVVMVSLMRKLIPEKEDRMLMGGAIVIAANAGGAFTPIGDVTTTMLWIDGKITAWPTMRDLFLPSLACFAFSTLALMPTIRGNL